ncbi:uncharacterized protein G2W53_019776 [Senna tora]|uniref:Uncharacterized protein n=1 Tax=Senna tora TaxID=362788 RepID=A0A834TWN6_9FABA|nr:uncharacterized protein G2W53_019776 [Senna tora]
MATTDRPLALLPSNHHYKTSSTRKIPSRTGILLSVDLDGHIIILPHIPVSTF